jgi:hypothetical protein
VLDDWVLAAEYHDPTNPGFQAGAARLLDAYGDRPAGVLRIAIQYAVLGLDPRIHIAWAIALNALQSLLLYAVLRRLRIERVHAAAISLLLLAFPGSDTTTFWITGAGYHWAIVLYLSGTLVAFQSLRSTSHPKWLLSAAALSLYVLSILSLEVLAVPVLLSAFLYRFAGASWAAAWRLWLAGVPVAAMALAFVGTQGKKDVGTFGEQLHHANVIQQQARQLIASVGVQLGPTRLPLLLVVAIVVGAVIQRFATQSPSLRAEISRWLLILACGLAVIAAGYVLYVPSDLYYSPSMVGVGNRVNAVSAPGYVILLYAIGVLAGLLVRRVAGNRVGIAVPLVLAGCLGALWISEVNEDRLAYDRSYALQRHVLDVLDRRVQRPSSGSWIYTFGVPGVTGYVPVFTTSDDLTGAVRLLWNEPRLFGVPSPTITGIECGPKGVKPLGSLYGEKSAARYGKAIFVHVPSERADIIRDRATCTEAAKRYLART